MEPISNVERELIQAGIEAGNEHTLLDFKKEWYDFENKHNDGIKIKNKFEFVKDCIAFLNTDLGMHKYIVIGIDDKSVKGNIITSEIIYQPEESNLQGYFKDYIDPAPQIDIYFNEDIGDFIVDIIRIGKENKNQPYFFKKSFEESSKAQHKTCKGRGYIRSGSRCGEITRSELDAIYQMKQSNMFHFFKIESNVNYSYYGDVIQFLTSMDKLLSRFTLDSMCQISPVLKTKLEITFHELVVKGSFFDEKIENESQSYISNLIMDCRDDFSKLNSVIDGGENSIVALIMCACYNWFILSKSETIKFRLENSIAYVNYDEKLMDHNALKKLDSKIEYINEILKQVDKVAYQYGKYVNLFKFKEIKYDESLSKFLNLELRYQVSEDIIPLLVEPLYKTNNKLEIALREMLQNSLDACKEASMQHFKGEDESKSGNAYNGNVNIEFKKDDDKMTVIFSDNGKGMSLEEITDFYLVVGKSSKKSSKTLVGKFGIGALSMFLISKEAKVITKDSGSYEYQFNLIQDKYVVNNIVRNSVKNKQSYTKIQLELDNVILSDNIENILKESTIEKWIICSDNLDVNVKFNDDTYRVPNIKDAQNAFNQLIKTDKLEVSIFENNKFKVIEKDDKSNKGLYKILNEKKKILYNDILINADYSRNSYKNINTSSIPLLVIEGSYKDADIEIGLSRDSATVGNDIFKEAMKYIYKREISKIVDYLDEHDGQKNSMLMKSEVIALTRGSIILPTIVMRKNRMNVVNSEFLESLSNENSVYEIYTNSVLDGIIQFNDEQYFYTGRLELSKANIANKMEQSNVKLISSRLIHKYITHATSGNDGFRINIAFKLLTYLMPHVTWIYDPTDLWRKVEELRNEIKIEINKKSLNGLFSLDGSFKIAYEYFSESVESNDMMLVESKLNDFRFKSSYDADFDHEYINQMGTKRSSYEISNDEITC